MTTSPSPRPNIGQVLSRGFHRRCPRCGEGPLFRRGIEFYDRCSRCGLVYQLNRGDTWLFLIFTDRVPLLILIGILYFGFRPSTPLGLVALCLVLIISIVATIRQRQGIALGLDYISRFYLPDPSDEIHAQEK